MSDEPWVGVAEAVAALREELERAATAGASSGSSLRFEVQPVELEFALEVRREGGGAGGVRLGVVTLGVKGGVSSMSTHRLKLALKPIDGSTGGPWKVRDRERG